jgi:hypothetical protein
MNENTQDKGEYWQELLKFIGKEVIIDQYDSSGNLIETKGILKALNFQYLNAILMTDNEKVLVKNFLRMRRPRSFKGAKNG